MIIQRLILDKQTGICILVGDGSPSGFAAPSGSIYINRLGGSNNILYAKYGALNTDWQVMGTTGSAVFAISSSYALSGSFARMASSASYVLSSGPIAAGPGSVGLPSFTRDTDTNTGLYFPSADTIGVTLGGVQTAQFASELTTLSGSVLVGIPGTTPATYINIRNAGGEFYIGRESSVAGTFFTGASAYASVIYSNGNNIQFIRSGVRRMEANSVGVDVTGSLKVSGTMSASVASYAPIMYATDFVLV